MDISFYLSRKRKNGKGLCPVYGRVISHKKSKDFSTGIFTDESNWGEGWPLSNAHECINRLSNISNEIYKHIAEHERKLCFNPVDVVRAYKKTPTSDVTLEIAQELISVEQPSDESELKIMSATKLFVELTGCTVITKVVPETLKGFVNRMKEKKEDGTQKFADTTIQKKLEFLKRVFVYAENKEYIRRNPFRFFKIPNAPDVEPPHLDPKEQKTLATHAFASDRLKYVRDLFLFSCNCGLSYGDLWIFSRENIITEADGREFITGKRFKFPHEEYYLPLLPVAQALAEKYNYCFRQISNQKYNTYLKEVGEILGFKISLSSKIARKTFSQNMIDAGYSTDVVAKMMGHKSFKMTRKHYGRIGQTRVQLESLKIAG
jgi:integrase